MGRLVDDDDAREAGSDRLSSSKEAIGPPNVLLAVEGVGEARAWPPCEDLSSLVLRDEDDANEGFLNLEGHEGLGRLDDPSGKDSFELRFRKE